MLFRSGGKRERGREGGWSEEERVISGKKEKESGIWRQMEMSRDYSMLRHYFMFSNDVIGKDGVGDSIIYDLSRCIGATSCFTKSSV